MKKWIKNKLDNIRNNRYLKYFIIAIPIIIVVPLIIDWFIIGNSFPSHISNSDWVVFLGGYIGALTSSAISLSGIIMTIRFTREQNRADRELQIRPYFDIKIINPVIEENRLGNIIILIDNNTSESKKTNDKGIKLKNVGTGPAINIRFAIEVDGLNCPYTGEYNITNLTNTTNSLRPDEEGVAQFVIYQSIPGLCEDNVVCAQDQSECKYRLSNKDRAKYVLPAAFIIVLKLKYEDLLGNTFIQTIDLKITDYVEKCIGGEFEYLTKAEIKCLSKPDMEKKRGNS